MSKEKEAKDDFSTGQKSDAAANGPMSSNVDGGAGGGSGGGENSQQEGRGAEEPGKGKSEGKNTAYVRPSIVVQASASLEEEKKQMYERSDELIAEELAKYCDEENLKKQPPLKFKGFRAEDEMQLFPAIERSSEILFEKYEQLRLEQKEDVAVALMERSGIIKIPNVKVRAYLCHRRLTRTPPPKSERKKLEPKRIRPNIKPRHPFLPVRGEDIFSIEKLNRLRAPLNFGWKREVVLRSLVSNGRKTGDVYYYPPDTPDRTKFRSSKQVQEYLEKTASQFTLENFSFSKVKVSDNADQEIVRVAHDGKMRKRPVANNPKPKPPINFAPRNKADIDIRKKSKINNSSSANLSVETSSGMQTQEVSSRQRRIIHAPKKYSSKDVLMVSTKRPASSKGSPMQMGMLPPKYPKCKEQGPRYTAHNNQTDDNCDLSFGSEVDSGINTTDLFQISALHQEGRVHQEMQTFITRSEKLFPDTEMKENPSTSKMLNIKESKKVVTISTRGSTNPIAPYPCSVLCPGLEGIPPTLQCSKCCCLFHAECFGLPPNLKLYNYLCNYCKGMSSSNSTSSLRNQSKGKRPVTTAAAKTARTVIRKQPMPSLRAAPAKPELLISPSGIRQARLIPPKNVRATAGIGRGTIMRPRQQPAPQPSPVRLSKSMSPSPPIYTVISPPSARKPIAANRSMINGGARLPKLSPVPSATNRPTLTKYNHLPFPKLIPGKPPPIPTLVPYSGTSRVNQRKLDLMPATTEPASRLNRVSSVNSRNLKIMRASLPLPTSIHPVRGRPNLKQVHHRPQLPAKKVVSQQTVSTDSSDQYIVVTVNSGVGEMNKVKYLAAVKPSAGPGLKKANLRNVKGADVRKSVAGVPRTPN